MSVNLIEGINSKKFERIGGENPKRLNLFEEDLDGIASALNIYLEDNIESIGVDKDSNIEDTLYKTEFSLDKLKEVFEKEINSKLSVEEFNKIKILFESSIFENILYDYKLPLGDTGIEIIFQDEKDLTTLETKIIGNKIILEYKVTEKFQKLFNHWTLQEGVPTEEMVADGFIMTFDDYTIKSLPEQIKNKIITKK